MACELLRGSQLPCLLGCNSRSLALGEVDKARAEPQKGTGWQVHTKIKKGLSPKKVLVPEEIQTCKGGYPIEGMQSSTRCDEQSGMNGSAFASVEPQERSPGWQVHARIKKSLPPKKVSFSEADLVCIQQMSPRSASSSDPDLGEIADMELTFERQCNAPCQLEQDEEKDESSPEVPTTPAIRREMRQRHSVGAVRTVDVAAANLILSNIAASPLRARRLSRDGIVDASRFFTA
eukprot:TRINITY_DN49192_c0_g1_i1.p1 TRINITY_DN49192_c0_g1~~TRINITY_DN49192_c0_g1_i1.p1  ORF type:complete len:259 (-),score=49.77 TRINITY_DN49192_c0_g1_i1:41-742(-)